MAIVQAIKESLGFKTESVIVTDKVNEIMQLLSTHENEQIKHITKVKIIEKVKKEIYKQIQEDKEVFGNMYNETVEAEKLFKENSPNINTVMKD